MISLASRLSATSSSTFQEPQPTRTATGRACIRTVGSSIMATKVAWPKRAEHQVVTWTMATCRQSRWPSMTSISLTQGRSTLSKAISIIACTEKTRVSSEQPQGVTGTKRKRKIFKLSHSTYMVRETPRHRSPWRRNSMLPLLSTWTPSTSRWCTSTSTTCSTSTS